MLRTPLSNTAEHTIHKHIKHLWNSLQCILHDTRCYLNVRSKADIIYRTANDDILNKSLTTHDYLQTVHRFSCAHQIKHQRATTAFHRSVKHWNSLMNFHTHACSNQNTVSVKASNGAHLKVEQWNSLTISLLAHTPVQRPLTGTTQVSRYQKGKTSLDFTEARDKWVAVASAGPYGSLHLAPDR